ncbi:Ribosome biogenesis protein nsa2 [Lasiodiplodia theobromae]|uniref:Ribosome biogenesis protein nsa2 n=1 Tax=Lasiodiplodia theobromae TaxID=45133 RepID=UPI0015C3B76E|nr:Ribosome biogenesis protein nsa2 [Lasiodiplodia theobromae]KAF4543954.1 Ribosome biogenesis protein nsa2 [Lasiodiplodia theobromae]
MELLKPMPKSKIDEMIDNVMEECEGMFDYVLGFDVHDDMSDAADSEYEESDADDIDDVVSPASPMFQRPGESSSPTSSSSSPQSAVLGSPAKCHTVAGESNRAGGTPRAATNARAGRSSNSSNAQRKRKAQGSDQQEENDDDGDGNSERKKQKKDSEEENKGLSQQELNTHHLAAERCPDVLNKPVIDGITDDQAKQLRSRRVKEGVKTEEAKWTNVYFILFPDDREAPSPYCVSNQDTASLSPESIMFQDFEDYSRREFPALFRAELKRDAEEEEALMQERFRRKMVDAARRATERLYTEYRRNRLQADTNSSGGAGPSQRMQASVSGQMEFLAPPPPQSDAIQDVRATVPRGGGSRGGPSAQADASSDSAYETLLSESNHAYLTARLPSTAAPGDLTQDQSRFGDPGLHLNAMIGGQPLSEGSNNPIDDPRIMQIQQQPEWYFDFLKDQNMYTDAYSEDPSLQAPFSGNSPMGGDPTNRNG